MEGHRKEEKNVMLTSLLNYEPTADCVDFTSGLKLCTAQKAMVN